MTPDLHRCRDLLVKLLCFGAARGAGQSQEQRVGRKWFETT